MQSLLERNVVNLTEGVDGRNGQGAPPLVTKRTGQTKVLAGLGVSSSIWYCVGTQRTSLTRSRCSMSHNSSTVSDA